MVSEKQKLAARKWDRENMRSVSCRLRKEQAEQFKEYCAENGTTPAAVLKKYILDILDSYYGGKTKSRTKKTK